MAFTAFKWPTKKLGMHGLFILGLGLDEIVCVRERGFKYSLAANRYHLNFVFKYIMF